MLSFRTRIFSQFLISAILTGGMMQIASCAQTSDAMWHQVEGGITNGLQPLLVIEQQGYDWNIEINFLAHAAIAENEWLKVTNRVGSKIQLWLPDGKAVFPKDNDALSALNLPVRTTVSDVMSGVDYRWKSRLWLPLGPNRTKPGTTNEVPSAHFTLKAAFGDSITNDVILKITPLLYHVDTNHVDARLIEFPSFKMKLLTNGNVERIE